MPVKDLTMGMKTRPKFLPFIYPDGTREMLPEKEVKNYIQKNPNSATARHLAKTKKTDS